MHASIALGYDDLANPTVTGVKAQPDGSRQVTLTEKTSLTLRVYLTADEALNLSQVFAGLADELAARDREVAA